MLTLAFVLLVLAPLRQEQPAKSTNTPNLSAAEVSVLRTKAESGDPAAQFALGQAYDFGTGVTQNDNLACAWYRKAAEQGSAPAQNSIGIMYRAGRGVEGSKEQAVEWYRKAARQGFAKAMFNLGTAYFNGDGVAVSDTTAYAWFLAAKEHGSDSGRDAVNRMSRNLQPWQQSQAFSQLAEMYEKGSEVQLDLSAAGGWYRKSAATGEPSARVKLAQFLIQQGGDQNYREALNSCIQAAKDLYPPAGMCAGYLHENGLGTAADLSEAAKWYNRSAQLGNALAMQRLSEMYWNGSGVKQDRVTAYTFALLAATSEIPDAQRNREAYEKALSSKEIDKGKKLAASWMKAHPPVGLVKR
jgi:TPR repeat protein